MVSRVLWDEQETAILVDYFMQFKNKIITRADAISKASEELRDRAAKNGLEIDPTFRNENGITMQMIKIEDLFEGGKGRLSKAPQVFKDIVNQYLNNKDSFDRILREARRMKNSNLSVEEQFFEWLSGKIPSAQMSDLYFAYHEIESFCRSKNILKEPLFKTTDISMINLVKSAVNSNKVFRFTYKKHVQIMQTAIEYYYKFIKENYSTIKIDAPNMKPIEKVTRTSVVDIQSQKKDNKYTVSFKSPGTYAFTRPDKLSYFGVNYTVESWVQLYVQLVRCLYDEYPQVIKKLCNMGTRQGVSVRIVDSLMKNSIVAPREIKDGFYLETKLNATDIVLKIKQLLEFCNIDHKNIVITYSLTNNKVKTNETSQSLPINKIRTEDILIDYLIKHDVPYSDKRYRGGCLWIKGGHELDNIVKYCAINFNVTFKYTDRGARSLGGEAGWWTSDKTKNTILKQVKKEKSISGELSKSIEEANSSAFLHWLITKQHIELSIAQNYVSSIHICGQMAFKLEVGNKRLYGIDYKDVQKTVSLLMQTSVFKEKDKSQNYQLSMAIAKYLSYLSNISDMSIEQPEKRSSSYFKPIEKLKLSVSYDDTLKENASKQYHEKQENKQNILNHSGEAYIPQSKETQLTEELSLYEKILRNNFQKGYRMDSGLHMKRFVRYYNDMNNTELNINDMSVADKIRNNILQVGILHENYVFSIDGLINSDTKKELLEYIAQCFSQGNEVLYYKALFKEFDEEFLGQRIYDENMLRTYLIHECKGQYVFEDDFMSREKNILIVPDEEVRNNLISYGAPMKLDELYKMLSYLPIDCIDKAIRTKKEIIWNSKKEYFDVSLIDLNENELEDIAYVIQQTIDEKHFLSSNELIDAIKRKYPDMLERFPQFSEIGLRDAIAYYLNDQFSFSGNIISPLHKQLSIGNVFAEFAKSHDSFTLDELNVLKNEMNSTIYLDSVYKNSLRISQKQFVAKKEARFDAMEIDKAISVFCIKDYIPLVGVTSFSMFPYAGFPWNIYLLEHFVAEYSIEYKLLHTSYAADSCAGAIVKRSSKINSFNDLLTDVLIESHINLNKNDALNYLCEMGYLSRRRYSDIDKILTKAKAQRGR